MPLLDYLLPDPTRMLETPGPSGSTLKKKKEEEEEEEARKALDTWRRNSELLSQPELAEIEGPRPSPVSSRPLPSEDLMTYLPDIRASEPTLFTPRRSSGPVELIDPGLEVTGPDTGFGQAAPVSRTPTIDEEEEFATPTPDMPGIRPYKTFIPSVAGRTDTEVSPWAPSSANIAPATSRWFGISGMEEPEPDREPQYRWESPIADAVGQGLKVGGQFLGNLANQVGPYLVGEPISPTGMGGMLAPYIERSGGKDYITPESIQRAQEVSKNLLPKESFDLDAWARTNNPNIELTNQAIDRDIANKGLVPTDTPWRAALEAAQQGEYRDALGYAGAGMGMGLRRSEDLLNLAYTLPPDEVGAALLRAGSDQANRMFPGLPDVTVAPDESGRTPGVLNPLAATIQPYGAAINSIGIWNLSETGPWKRGDGTIAEGWVRALNNVGTVFESNASSAIADVNAIAEARRSGDSKAALAYQSLWSGTADKSLYELTNRDEISQNYLRMAQETGDPLEARKYYVLAQEWANKTDVEIIEHNTNPWAAIVSGALLDPVNLLDGPLGVLFGPEARALAKQARLSAGDVREGMRFLGIGISGDALAKSKTYNYLDDVTKKYNALLGKIEGSDAQVLADMLGDSSWQKYSAEIAALRKDPTALGSIVDKLSQSPSGRKIIEKFSKTTRSTEDARLLDHGAFWNNVMPQVRTRETMALRDAETIWSTALTVLSGAETSEEILKRLTLWATDPQKLADQVGIGIIGNKQAAEALKTLRLALNDIRGMRSLRPDKLTDGKVAGRPFYAELYETLLSASNRLYGGGQPGQATQIWRKYSGTDAIKGFMSLQWLIFRPGNWARNSLGAGGMAYSVDGLSAKGVDEWIGYLSRPNFGPVPGSPRILDVLTPEQVGRTAGTEAAAPGGLAGLVAKIPYGASEVGPFAIGEQAWYTKIYGTVFNRVLERSWADTVKLDLGKALLEMGADPQTTKRMVNLFVQTGVDGKMKLGEAARDLLSSSTLPFTRQQLGFPDGMGVGLTSDVDDLVSDFRRRYMAGDMPSLEELSGQVWTIFEEHKSLLGERLFINPSLDRYQWMEQARREGPAYVASVMSKLQGAGLSPQQMNDMRKQAAGTISHLQNARTAAFAKLTNDLANSPPTVDTVNVIYDFFVGMLDTTWRTRAKIDEIHMRRLAGELSWQDAVKMEDEAFRELAGLYTQVSGEARNLFLNLRQGTPYRQSTRWGEALERWTSGEGMRDLRRQLKSGEIIPADLPGAEGTSEFLIRMEAMRADVDNSFINLLEGFRLAPTAENFDLLNTAFTNVNAMGSTVNWISGQLKKGRIPKLAKGKVPKGMTVDELWEQYGLAVRLKNWSYYQVMIANGIQEKLGPNLTWADSAGQQWKLGRPLGNGRWQASPYLPQGVTGPLQKPRIFQEPGKGIQGLDEVPEVVLDIWNDTANSLAQTPHFVTLPEDLQNAIKQFQKDPDAPVNWYDLFGFDTYNPNAPAGPQILEHVMGNLKFSRENGHYVDTVGDVAAGTLDTLDTMRNNVLRNLESIVTGMENGLTPQQKMRIIDWADSAEPAYQQTVHTARTVATKVGNFAMLDFNDRRNWDIWLSMISPFPYFWSHMPSRGVQVSLSKPSVVNRMQEMQEGIQVENQQVGLPRRNLGTVPNPMRLLGETIGNEFLASGPNRLANPVYYIMPFMSYLEPNPYINIDQESNWLDQSWLMAQKYGGLSLLPQYSLLLALGDAVFRDKYEGLHEWDIGDQILLLRAGAYAFNPSTAGTSISQHRLGLDPNEEGANKPLRELWASLTRFGTVFDPGVANREISNMNAEGLIDPEATENPLDSPESLAKWGMDVGQQIHEGVEPLPEQPEEARAIWEEGARRMGKNKLTAILGSFFIGLGLYTWSDAEQELANLTGERRTLGWDQDEYARQYTTATYDGNPVTQPIDPNDPRMGSQAIVDQFDAQKTGVTTESGQELTNRNVAEPRWIYGEGYEYYTNPENDFRYGQEAVKDEVATGKGIIYDEYGKDVEALAAKSDPRKKVPYYYTDEGEKISKEKKDALDSLFATYTSYVKPEDTAKSLRVAERRIKAGEDPAVVLEDLGLVDYHGNKNPAELQAAVEDSALYLVKEENPKKSGESGEEYEQRLGPALDRAMSSEPLLMALSGGRIIPETRPAQEVVATQYDDITGPEAAKYSQEREAYLAEQRGVMVDKFGEEAVALFEAAPNYDPNNPDEYRRYMKENPDAAIVANWRNGIGKSEYYDDGKEFDEAIELFGPDIWTALTQYDPDNWTEEEKDAYYDQYPEMRDFWPWFFDKQAEEEIKHRDSYDSLSPETKAMLDERRRSYGLGPEGGEATTESGGTGGKTYGKGKTTVDPDGRTLDDWWDEYNALPDNASKAEFLRENKWFEDQYWSYIQKKDPEADKWWLEYGSGKAYSNRYTGGYSVRGGSRRPSYARSGSSYRSGYSSYRRSYGGGGGYRAFSSGGGFDDSLKQPDTVIAMRHVAGVPIHLQTGARGIQEWRPVGINDQWAQAGEHFLRTVRR